VKVYAKPRGGGKTHELIKLAADRHLVVICASAEMAGMVAKRARELGLDIPQPLSWRQVMNGAHRGRRINGYVIDDADACLQQIVGTPAPVVAVSLTNEPEG
jgi:hypothetical protein